jgi:hypothetical protein
VVQLTPKDSSILTRITRYKLIPKAEREALLGEASAQAWAIGAIILGTSTGDQAEAEIKQAANAYRKSFDGRRRIRRQRRVRRNVAG